MQLNVSTTKYPTNQDVKINYVPKNSDTYVYKLYKDGEVIEEKELKIEPLNITLVETGTYHLELRRITNGKIEKIATDDIVIDKEAPILEVGKSKLNLYKGDKIKLMGDVTTSDNYSKEIKVTTNYSKLDLSKEGKHNLVYKAIDEAGNISSKEVTLNVISRNEIVYFQTGIILVCILCIAFLLKYIRSLKLEKRIMPYTLDSLKKDDVSLFDNIVNSYQKIQFKISESFENSSLLVKLSKRYSKYIPLTDNHLKEIDFITDKLVCALVIVGISFISQIIRFNLLTPYELIIPFIIGFFMIDIYYGVKYKIYYKKLENDLLQAVMIMNNAFKAGKSITQAVELVSIELDGPIGNEFNKMLVELNFGLDINVVFSRFEERVQIKEAEYLTASLSILNSTGGDIIKIFNTIEKTLIDKKKLQFELEALTASSKIILYVLFIVPFLFILFITMLEPTYFNPFFTSSFGFAIFVIIVILYLIYIYIISKLMKVRM